MKLFQVYKTNGYARWVMPFMINGNDIVYSYGLEYGDRNYPKVSIEAESIYEFEEEFKRNEKLTLTDIEPIEKENMIEFLFIRRNDIFKYIGLI